MSDGITDAIEIAGSQSELARQLGLPQTTIGTWARGVHPVPAEHLAAIWKLTGIRPSRLRPDLKEVLKK